MAESIVLVAHATFPHHGRQLARGEVFVATPVEALILIRRRVARFAPRDLRAEDVPVQAPVSRRRYHRRDMVADD